MKDWEQLASDLTQQLGAGDQELERYRRADADMIRSTLRGYGPYSGKQKAEAGARAVYNLSAAHVPAVVAAGAASPFQYGLFIADQEVAFPSLDAVIEFVRRAYLRGGGGDAAGGGGAGVPPRTTPGALGPEGERPLEGEGGRGHGLSQSMLKDPGNARLAERRSRHRIFIPPSVRPERLRPETNSFSRAGRPS
jgi:hypothetical protein